MPRSRAHAVPVVSEQARRAVAIGAGGAIGTLARYGVDRALPGPVLGFPWGIFVVNIAGSLFLGFLVTALSRRWPPTLYVRPFAAIGFCGGFTTFSTLAVEVAQLGQHGRVLLAAVYLLTSVVAGMAAAAVGIALARGRPGGGQRSPIPDPDDLGFLNGGTDSRRPQRGGERS